jgi:toxin ParE1/3/4
VKRRAVTKKPRAKADLLEHYVFIGEENVTAADRFLAAAEAAFKRLATMPRMGRRWRSDEPQIDAVRVWPIPGWKYLVFYRPTDTGIDVIRVLHGAQDVTTLIANEGDE